MSAQNPFIAHLISRKTSLKNVMSYHKTDINFNLTEDEKDLTRIFKAIQIGDVHLVAFCLGLETHLTSEGPLLQVQSFRIPIAKANIKCSIISRLSLVVILSVTVSNAQCQLPLISQSSLCLPDKEKCLYF